MRVICGLGYRVQGIGFRVQGLGFRVQGLGFRVQALSSCTYRVEADYQKRPGYRVQGLWFRVQGLGSIKLYIPSRGGLLDATRFRVQGIGYSGYGLGVRLYQAVHTESRRTIRSDQTPSSNAPTAINLARGAHGLMDGGIRQHTSAYVSIRLAYVFKRADYCLQLGARSTRTDIIYMHICMYMYMYMYLYMEYINIHTHICMRY